MFSAPNPQESSSRFDQSDILRTLSLEVEGCQFWVCREILASYSPVFKAMLYGEFVEANQDVIKLPGKKAFEVEEFLLCLIPDSKTGETKSIDYRNVEIVLKLADEYQVNDLRKRAGIALVMMAEKFPKKDSRLLGILRISSQYRLKEALELIVKRCAAEFSTDELEAGFGGLRPEVIACLMKYQSTSVLSKCRYQHMETTPNVCPGCKKSIAHRLSCVHCGTPYCPKCLVKTGQFQKATCTTNKMANADKVVHDLLSRM